MTLPLTPQMRELLRPGNLHRFCHLWTVTRLDGTIHRFTDHSRPIQKTVINTWDPFSDTTTTWYPGGFKASARMKADEIVDVHVEFGGAYPESPTANDITFEDLRGRDMVGATVKEEVVDWRYPWAGAFDSQLFYVDDLQFDHEKFTLECNGFSRFLKAVKTLTYSLSCRHTLGDTGCGVDLTLGNFSYSNTVGTVLDSRNEFTISTPSGTHDDDWYAGGFCEFTSGLNNGVALDVRTYTMSSGRVLLTTDAPRTIQVGDAFTIYAGCNKSVDHCRDKFLNTTTSGVGLNIGATPYIPGPHFLHSLNVGLGGFTIPPVGISHPDLLDDVQENPEGNFLDGGLMFAPSTDVMDTFDVAIYFMNGGGIDAPSIALGP